MLATREDVFADYTARVSSGPSAALPDGLAYPDPRQRPDAVPDGAEAGLTWRGASPSSIPSSSRSFLSLSLAASNTAAVVDAGGLAGGRACLAAAALLWCLLRPLLGSWQKAGVMTSLLEVAFFSYAPLHAASQGWLALRHRYALPLLAAVLLAALWKLRRSRGEPVVLAQGLTFVSAFLLVVSATRLVRSREPSAVGSAAGRPAARHLPPAAAAGLPDVYYVILTGTRARRRSALFTASTTANSSRPSGPRASTWPTEATATTRRRHSLSRRRRTWSI